jgi:hypothetical protein
VDTLTGLGAGQPAKCFRSSANARDFSVLRNSHTGSGGSSSLLFTEGSRCNELIFNPSSAEATN